MKVIVENGIVEKDITELKAGDLLYIVTEAGEILSDDFDFTVAENYDPDTKAEYALKIVPTIKNKEQK